MINPFIVNRVRTHTLEYKNNYKVMAFSLFALMTTMVFIVDFSSIDKTNAQKVSYVSVGNNTNMSDDTLFQLDDSILKAKNLANSTLFEIEAGNTTTAQGLLNQIYGELADISVNSNNLIWDESNKGN
jgi:hypothetical protein